ncbi:hypothetical protein ACS0TY_003346 [Phlomoides rotata]
MKGGKKRNTNTDPVQPSPPPPPPSHPTTITESAGEGSDAVEEDLRKSSEESGKLKATEDSFEEEGAEELDSEAEREYLQAEDSQFEEAVVVEDGRTKLADGYYEIEAVRRKRVRKGQLQYLIKWRGWSEGANTWEPVENLIQCSDIIDAFEESLKSGKTRKRKRKSGIAHVLPKKKNQQVQQQSPAADTYIVPSHMIRVTEEPVVTPRINDSSCMNESEETVANGIKSVETSEKVNENGGMVASDVREEDEEEEEEEEKEQNELDLKLCELKGAMVTSVEDANKFSITSLEGKQTSGDTLANGVKKTDGVEPVQAGRCTGAKRRKSGSVKRFTKDPDSGVVDDAANGVPQCPLLVPSSVQNHDFLGNSSSCKTKCEDAKSLCTIVELVKPINYKPSISVNVHEVLVTFEAKRSDGTKVIVDNKFLKANNPLLLIEFYEKHLRYTPT